MMRWFRKHKQFWAMIVAILLVLILAGGSLMVFVPALF